MQHESDHLQGKMFLEKVKDKSTLVHESEFFKTYDPAADRGTYTEVPN